MFSAVAQGSALPNQVDDPGIASPGGALASSSAWQSASLLMRMSQVRALSSQLHTPVHQHPRMDGSIGRAALKFRATWSRDGLPGACGFESHSV